MCCDCGICICFLALKLWFLIPFSELVVHKPAWDSACFFPWKCPTCYIVQDLHDIYIWRFLKINGGEPPNHPSH
jgi:hypothetical protein